MSILDKTLAMEDFTIGHTFRTSKSCTLILLRSYVHKLEAHPVLLSVHFSRLDMLTPSDWSRWLPAPLSHLQ